jgi:prophage tail gpP-like protein
MSDSFILEINGKEWTNFNSFEIDLKYDSVASTFSIETDYDVTNPLHLDLFSPLKYRLIKIWANVPNDNGTQTHRELVLTGTILNHSSSSSKEKSLLGLSGYSITGVLEDCTIDVKDYPLQVDGLDLGEIVTRLIKPFGLGLYISGGVNQDLNLNGTLEDTSNAPISADANAKYSKIDFKANETIKEIITKLTSQRNVVLTHDAYGTVILTTLNISSLPKATYSENKPLDVDHPMTPTTKISLNINGQALHNKLSIVREASLDSNESGQSTIDNSDSNQDDEGLGFSQIVDPGILNNQLVAGHGQSTSTNDWLVQAYHRPTMKEQTTGENQTADAAVKMLMASELKNIKLTIDTDRWTWLGKGNARSVIRPNNIIKVNSPSNFIFKDTLFFVENVKLIGTPEAITASLECVLPNTFTGEVPSYIFRK